MKFNKKFAGPAAVVLGLIVTVLSFQNCAQNHSSSSGSTGTTSSDTTGTVTNTTAALSYPVTTSVVLVPGQSTTIKIVKPSAMGDSSNYIWYAYGDNHALAAHYGIPVENNGYLYVSLMLKSSFSGTQDIRVYFWNYSTSTYLDGNGIKVRMTSSGTPFSQDAAAELCDLRPDYVPSFTFTKTAAAADALYVFDTGGGIGSLSCTFTDSSGNTSASVDCLNTSAWPSTWASSTLNLYGTNRCGTNTSRSF